MALSDHQTAIASGLKLSATNAFACRLSAKMDRLLERQTHRLFL